MSASATKEVAHVQECDDEVIEGVDGACLHGKSAAVICSQAALHLHTDLSRNPTWIGMNADEIVALVIRRRLVRKDVAPHEIAHDEMLCAQRHDGESRELRRWALGARAWHRPNETELSHRWRRRLWQTPGTV